MRKLIIRNGRVIDPATRLDAIRDVLIEERQHCGASEKICTLLAPKNSTPLGLIVAPGFIDMHVHSARAGI